MFVNRKADYAKCLYWSRGGYCLWAKRLEAGRFANASASVSTNATSTNATLTNAVTMTDTQLMMWLDGIELDRVKQRKRFVLPREGRDQQAQRDIAHRI